MGQQGSADSRSNNIDRVEEAVLKGVTEDGEEVFFEVSEDGQLQATQQADNGASLTDIISSVAADEARVRLFGEDDADTLVEANLMALDDAPADGDISVLTYLSRALNSKDLDEFITRVTDSAGTQIDPATAALENALKANDADEFITRVTDSAGTEVDPATAALENALKSNDTDEFVSRIAGADGVEVAEEALDTGVTATDIGLLTYLSRALESVNQDTLNTNGNNDDSSVDVDIDTYDLVASGDYTTNEVFIAGLNQFVIKVASDDNEQFTVEVDWTDGSGNVLYTDDPAAGDTTTDAQLTFNVSSDHAIVRITDESGVAQNQITGTINVHP